MPRRCLRPAIPSSATEKLPMFEIDPEYLKHQYLYVPWVEGLDTVSAGKALWLHVAQKHNARLTIATGQKSNASFYTEFSKLPVVTV